jgi:hypothetical protein
METENERKTYLCTTGKVRGKQYFIHYFYFIINI